VEVPEVVCEFSVGPRRFEVTRSPAWERPKKRGEGTTLAQARVLVRELVHGEWVVLSTRIDEAAHLLDDVLGMGPDQFTKLVLLPQGEFAAFLRADAESRRTLLEKLFGTDRFAAVQDWLRERRGALRAEVESTLRLTATLLAKADQAAAVALRTTHQELTADDEPADPAARLAELETAVEHTRTEALAHQMDALARRERAEMKHDQAQAMAQLAGEFELLVARQETLDRGLSEVEQNRARLRRAAQARALAPLVPAVRSARTRYAAALAAQAQADAALPDPPPGGGPQWSGAALIAEEARLRDTQARLTELDGEAAERDRLAEAREACAVAARDADLALARARALSIDAAERAGRHTAAAARAGERAAALGADRSALRLAEQVAAAVVAREQLTIDLEAVAAEHESARASANAAKEHYLDLRERRLDTFAAELAATLGEGLPCRVCGSTEHPAPATRGPADVDAAQEEAARLAADGVAAQVSVLASRRARVAAELAAAARTADGARAEEAAQALAAARSRVDEAVRAAEDLVEQRDGAETARAEQAEAQARVEAAETGLTGLRQELAATTARLESLRERLAGACDGQADLGARLGRVGSALHVVRAALAARDRVRGVADQLEQVSAAATAAAAEGGVDSLDEAIAAAMSEEDFGALERATIDYQVEHESVYEQLADERFTALNTGTAAVLDVVGLRGLADDVEHAQVRELESMRRVALCESAAQELSRIAAALTEHLATSAPVLERFRAIDDLSRCAEGTGGDNTKRMSLSAFVLAARLEQVAAAATVRLAQMSSGRYALVHSDAAERGRSRTGLSLEVVDAWTGARRETSSLSGGESFYTSLALALGLADVVSAESGGVRIDTLFIDEGFGSLDEETLDEVMDVLDGLRSGGRAVGVVSHLAELRQRIAVRLEVAKTPQGSTLRANAS
jgi:exonuclease SbcC